MLDAQPAGLFEDQGTLDALLALEQNTSDSVARMRAHERFTLRVKVLIRRADASERHGQVVEAVTADISNGGSMMLSPRPLSVGDFFLLSFDPEQLELGSLFARCLRCRFVSEDAFEVGFRFLDPVDVSGAIRITDSDSPV